MKFYQRGWFIWLMLILFAPVGIILLWTQKKYKPVIRVILSVVFLILFIAVVSPGGTDEPASNDVAGNNPTAAPATQSEKPLESTPEPKPEPTPEPTPEYEIEITAKELAEAFNDNEIRANQNYKGKIAKIEGEISDFGEVLGQTYIVLSNEDDSFSNFVDVQCYFRDKDEINKIAQKNKGDKVVIIGKIEGKSINVSVENCKFTD